jgi:hypothetical protein
MDTDIKPRTKVLSNGAIYDLDAKRIVKGAVWSSDDTKSLAQARRAKKQQAIIEAANVAAVIDACNSDHPEIRDLIQPGDSMAFVKAIALGRQVAAMDADSPYGNAAANWLIDNSGVAETRQEQAGNSVQVNVIRIVLHDDTPVGADATDAQVVDITDNNNDGSQ